MTGFRKLGSAWIEIQRSTIEPIASFGLTPRWPSVRAALRDKTSNELRSHSMASNPWMDRRRSRQRPNRITQRASTVSCSPSSAAILRPKSRSGQRDQPPRASTSPLGPDA